MKAEGICKLTGASGRYVDSHLLPKALTRAGRTRGEKFIEDGPDALRLTEVSSSWYDSRLVIRDGEAILSRYDHWGIQELRRSGLIWSSTAPLKVRKDQSDNPSGLGTLSLRINHPRRLRLFFLSLLWRAAATDLPAFRRISLVDRDVEYLRTLVANGLIGEATEFPMLLWSLLEPGIAHNHTPIYQGPNDLGSELPIHHFRFYFDGLLLLIGERDTSSSEFWMNAAPYRVHENPDLLVVTQPFRLSRQHRDIVDVALGVHRAA